MDLLFHTQYAICYGYEILDVSFPTFPFPLSVFLKPPKNAISLFDWLQSIERITTNQNSIEQKCSFKTSGSEGYALTHL